MLHIHNGDSSADTARKSSIPGNHLAWREALVCGPTPGDLTDDEFISVREQHLSETYGVPNDECVKASRHQYKILEAFTDHEEVVLWFEHDLFCQALLVYLLSWFARHDRGNTKLSLICIDRFPGVEDFRGLGQLNEQQLASLFPQRVAISDAQLELGTKAWAAYSASTPEQLESLVAGETSALPFLKPALIKHLERFPSTRNGLGRIENVLLELIAGGKSEFKSLFQGFLEREPIYGFGDSQIYFHLTRLAQASRAALTMSSADAVAVDSVQMAKTSFQITEQGQRFVRGEDDFVKLNGIDRWLGGVHLKGDEDVWRWNEVAKALECGPD